MKKNNKGFTLIELLVVVAIIGILAAVGTVAYTGYTKNAKKNATKSNQAAVVKYIAAEMTKCAMGETTVLKTLTCSASTYTDDAIADAAALALADFKNPYNTSEKGVVTAIPTGVAAADKVTVDSVEYSVGYTVVSNTGNAITVGTCFEATCAAATIVTNAIDAE